MSNTYFGKVINAFSNKDFKLTNTAITVSSNIDTATPGTIIYNKNLDRFEGYVANTRTYNDSNFVPMNLDTATSSNIGGIKIGNNLTITNDGILNSTASSVSRKFQKVLLISQSKQVNENDTDEEIVTGDYISINQCIKQFFDYNENTEEFTGEIASLDKDEYPDPSENNKYVILLCPDEYNEDKNVLNIANDSTINLPPNTVLMGDDRDSCIINIKNLTSIKAREGCVLRNLTIDLTRANDLLTPSSTSEIIKAIELLTNNNNIILDNIVFRLSQCNFHTSFIYGNTNNNIHVSNLQMTTPTIYEGGNTFLDPEEIECIIFDITSGLFKLDNINIYLETARHKKSIIKSQNLSLITCNYSRLEIKEVALLLSTEIENQSIYMIDSTIHLTYSTIKCQGFDNNFTNEFIRCQGIKIESTQNYNVSSSEMVVFEHNEVNNTHDLIKVPDSEIDFGTKYVNDSKIKISGSTNNNLVVSISYVNYAIITELSGGDVNGSTLGCDFAFNLTDEVINSSDNREVIFKELYQITLFSCQIISDSETLFFKENNSIHNDNYYILINNTLLNGINLNVSDNKLIFNVPNEIIVGIENSNFNSVADALNSITNANEINKIIVRVKPGTYLESKQITIPSHVSLIGENSIIKFDISNTSNYPNSSFVSLSSNIYIKNIEFIFDKAIDILGSTVCISTSNFDIDNLNINSESYMNSINSIENVVFQSVNMLMSDNILSSVSFPIVFLKSTNTELNDCSITFNHNILSLDKITINLIYNKLCQMRFTNFNLNISGYIENYAYNVILNDASTNILTNPNIKANITTNSSVDNDSNLTIINTTDFFEISNINNLDLSIYNTLVLGGSIRGIVDNDNTVLYSLFADYNATLIGVGVILEGLPISQNNRNNDHPNSLLKTMSCFLLSSDGQLISEVTELSSSGGSTTANDSLHVGDPVGALNIVPRNNVLVGVRVALLNSVGVRNTMLGVDVGTSQESGNDNVFLGYRSGRSNLLSENTYIGSNVASSLINGSKNIIIGKDTGNNSSNIDSTIMIGNETGMNIDNLSNAIIIGKNIFNTDNSNSKGDLILIGSNNLGDNLSDGINNLSIGNESMISATSLSNTLIMGHKGYQDVESGIYNIAIGNNTGEGIITSNLSIVIGNNGVKGNNVDSKNINNIMIGNNIASSITTAKDNLLIGNSVAPNMTSASRNIILGSKLNSGGILTTPAPRLTSGNDNIITGSESASNLSIGSRNIVMGNKSGQNINNTNDTIIIGYESANSLRDGGEGINRNIVIGNYAANSAVSGNIIVIGHEAGKNLTGEDSLIIGNMAARNISGVRNTIIGNKAVGISDNPSNPVMGQDNVIFGTYSGYQLSTGSYNVVLGSGNGSAEVDELGFDSAGAGYSLQGGNKNFLAGFNAGRSLVNGSEHVLIGSRAGYSLSNSNKNVIIGNNAGTRLGSNDNESAQSNNNLIIGNNAGSNIGLGNNLLLIGQSAGQNSIEGANNTFIGNNAGENNNGDDNTYIGNQAGQYNDVGDKNTMIGVSSGKFSDNANFNTFIGYESGRGKDTITKNTGDYNTTIGYQAGKNLVTGNQNLYIGFQSGSNNENGSKNIGIGPNTGLNSTTSRSIFIGATENTNTGVGMNTSGDFNLFVGTDSGVLNTTGEKNVFVGSHAGQNNTTGNGSIFIGVDAGKNNTLGNDNLFIGRETGKSITTGINNVMIGMQAGTDAINDASENILIGTLAGSKTQINNSINIGNKSGQNNISGIGNILVGPKTGQQLEESCNNIMIGSNAGANFRPTGENITLGENIYIGSEVGRNNITGIRNIVVGSDAFKSSVQGSGVIAIGYKAGQNAGVLAENVGGNTYENTIIGFEAGSEGDFGLQNVMIGSKTGRNVDNARKFEGNVLLGSETGKNSNLSINSVVLGGANKIGQGGVNNVIAGTDSGDNLGNLNNVEFELSSNLEAGFNTITIGLKTYGEIISKLQINDRILIDDGTNYFESIISGIRQNDQEEDEILISLEDSYNGDNKINIGGKVMLLSNIDNVNIGDTDKSKSSSNTLMGNQSSNKLLTGSKNVALGDQSMHENKIGKYNNILGTQAGYHSKTDNNTLFGTKAGYYLDSFVGNSSVSYSYNGFTIDGNTISFDTNISTDLDLGTIIDLDNTTGNNRRFKISSVTPRSFTVEGSPKIDELGVENNIDPDSIIINASKYNFSNILVSSNNDIEVVKDNVSLNASYSFIKNSTSNLGVQFGNSYEIIIEGSKYNDGVHYLYKDDSTLDNTMLRTYNTLYPEVFDSNVKIISRSINTNSPITLGFSFQDIIRNGVIYSFLGSTKGIYRIDNTEVNYPMLKPLNITIGVEYIPEEQTNISNTVFTIGHIENISNINNNIDDESYIIIGNIEFINNEIDTIIFQNAISLQLSTDITTHYYSIYGTVNNNKTVKFIKNINNLNKEYNVEFVNGDIVNEVIESDLINTTVKLVSIQLTNLSITNENLIKRGTVLNINMTHSLGQKNVAGTYLIESSNVSTNTIQLIGESRFPVMKNRLAVGNNRIEIKNINFKMNNEIFNVDDEYLNDKDNYIQGYDLMFQSGEISNALNNLIIDNALKTLSSMRDYQFRDLIAPCMIKIDSLYLMVKSNKYPFTILEIDDEDDNIDLNSITPTSTIYYHSISSYQNSVDLTKLSSSLIYKIFGNDNNHLTNIQIVEDVTAKNKRSVYLTPETVINTSNSNNKLIIVEARHEDFPFNDASEVSEGFGRGYFKHLKIDNVNVNLKYNSLGTEFENISTLNNFNIEQKELLFIPDNDINNKKYNLIMLETDNNFITVTEPDNTFDGSSNLNTIVLSGNNFTFMGDSYSNIVIDTHGYLFFEGENHKHVYNFLTNVDNVNYIDSSDNNSNIRTKIISTSDSNSDILVIDFTSNINGGGSGKSRDNNCQLQLYLENADYRKGRIYNNYSNINVDTVIVGLDSTEAIVKENREQELVNGNKYNSPLINLNYGNYSDYNNKKITLTNNLILPKFIPIKITANDGSSNDKFGNFVDIYGDYIVVSAVNDDDAGSNSGSAYVFKKEIIDGLEKCDQIFKLTASDGATDDEFGNSVAIYDNYIVVGSLNDDDNGGNSGSAYVFKNNGDDTYSQIFKLTASDGNTNDRFGCSVDIYDDYIVIGAYDDDDNGFDSGSAYVFKNNGDDTYSEIFKLTPNDGSESDEFGNSVAIYDDYILIGAVNFNNITTLGIGAAYVFKNNGDDTYSEIVKLTSNNSDAFDEFGYSLDIYNNYIVIGSRNQSAYVFKNNGSDVISQIFKLTASDGSSSDKFGNSVSIYDDYIIIGSFENDDNNDVNSGASYIFKNNGDDTFKEILKLTANDGSVADKFGTSVAIYENYIVSSSSLDDDNGNDSGSAYIYKLLIDNNVNILDHYLLKNNIEFNIFPQLHKLTPNDGASNDNFGKSVDIYGDYIVIGSHFDDDNGSGSGSAYVYKNNGNDTFNQIFKLTASDGSVSDRFGFSVAIYNDYIVIGAYSDDDNGSNSGTAYVFKNNGNDTFNEVFKLTANDGSAGDKFGFSVAIYNDYIVIGAYDDDDNGTDSGSAYVFKKDTGFDTYSQIVKLTASDGSTDDEFGYSVAIYNDYIVIGARLNDSVYVFKNNGLDSFFQLTKLTSGDDIINEFGTSVDINGDYIVIGAVSDTGKVEFSGSAYVFKKSIENNVEIFNKIDKLTANDGFGFDKFGTSVAIYNDYIVIGAISAEGKALNSGTAYVFQNIGNDMFNQIKKITASDGEESDEFGTSVSIYENYIVISAIFDNDNGESSGSAYVFKNGEKQYLYNIETFNNSIDITGYTEITDEYYNSNLIIFRNLISNVSISNEGYVYFNDNTGIESSNQLLKNNYLTLLNNISFSNIYVSKFDNLAIESNFSIVYSKNNVNIIKASFLPYDSGKIEIITKNLDIIFNDEDVKSTLGINLFQNNNYSLNKYENNNKKHVEILNNENYDNLNLIQKNDILKYGNDYSSIISINNSNIEIYNDSTDESFDLTTNILINEYVAYDVVNSNARVNFENLIAMTGINSKFLRFIKLRQPNLKTIYNENELTVDNYPNITLLDKDLNLTLDTTILSGGKFIDTIDTNFVISLMEKVPNEYVGNDTSNLVLISDYYAIALGESVFEFNNDIEMIANINTKPKGYIDMFLNKGKASNTNIADSLVFISKDITNFPNEIYTGNIEITSNVITFNDISFGDSNYLTLNNYSGVKKINKLKSFEVLKPGNIINIYFNNNPINNTHENSTYLIKDYSEDGLTINIDGAFNNTSNLVAFTSDDKLEIYISHDYNVSSSYLRGHLISDRYDISSLNNITNMTSLSTHNNLTNYISVINYPVLNHEILFTNKSFKEYSYEVIIPEWGLKPITKSKVGYSYDKTLDFYTLNNNNSGNVNDNSDYYQANTLDIGTFTNIIPNNNLSQNINSTNIFFTRINNTNVTELIFNKSTFELISNDNNFAFVNDTFTDSSELLLKPNQILNIKGEISDNNEVISIFVQVHPTITPTVSSIRLNIDYPTTSIINKIFEDLDDEISIIQCFIESEVIMSSDIESTDLSIFKSGQRIKITNTLLNNELYDISPRANVVPECIYITDLDVIPEKPELCSIERIILQDEIGSLTSISSTLDPITNSIIVSNSYVSSFKKGQTIVVNSNFNSNTEYTISNSIESTNDTLFIEEDISQSEVNVNIDILKKIFINIIGTPIKSNNSSSIFHYQDAQGNNMMLGSFTGQFSGYKNLSIHNTYIGNKVGQTNHGSGNVFFGSETGLAIKPTDGESFYNNKFAIYKNNFIGIPNKPLIGGDFGSGTVGINTINPDNLIDAVLDQSLKLVVNGSVRASSHSTFTGTHMVTFSEDENIREIEPGMIVSATGNVRKISLIDTIVECKLTVKEKDKKVFGVYSNSQKILNGKTIHFVAGLGEGQIWVSNMNGDVDVGDYICSSNLEGYCMLQDDDLTHNYTVGKITEYINWENVNKYKLFNGQEYKIALLGCVYMCS
jgi:hypothetical protein